MTALHYSPTPPALQVNITALWNYSSTAMTNLTDTNGTTMAPHVKSQTVMMMDEIAKWINGFIIILGFITNSLILLVLTRRRIGSKYATLIMYL